MNIDSLQNLAKSNEAQITYHRAKELSSLQLFENNKDLSRIQILYLYYLELYSMLYQDLQMQEEYLTEEIIHDSLRCEAYLLYRKIYKNNKNKKSSTKTAIDNAGQGTLIFKRKNK